MFRTLFTMIITALLPLGTAYGGIVITEEVEDGTETHIYQDGIHVELWEYRVQSIIDLNSDVCTFYNHEHKVYAQGKCGSMAKEMDAAMARLMRTQFNEMSPEEREMMHNIDPITPQQNHDISPKRIGTVSHLGYRVERFSLGEWREVWVSESLSKEIKKEFDEAKFDALLGDSSAQPQETEGDMSSDALLEGIEDAALFELRAKGYIVKDLDWLLTLHSNPLMPEMIPQNEIRKRIEKLKAQGARPGGRQVVKVEKKAIDLGQYQRPGSDYQKVSAQRLMEFDLMAY